MKTTPSLIGPSLRRLNLALTALCLCLGLPSATLAQTTLSYTNMADAWLTPTSWAPANNWNSGTVKTNATTTNVRLNIGTNTTVNQAVSVTYNASMGTTVLSNGGVSTLNLVIGSGNSTTGAVTIAGGTLIMLGGTPNTGFAGAMVGNAAAGQAVQGSLTLSGGNFVFTNAAGSANSIMSVPYRGGSTVGGPNFASGTFTIGGGSTATIDRVFFGYNAADTAAQTTGTINLNAGGTLSTRNIAGRDSDGSQMTSVVNFNGGTLQVYGPNSASTGTPFISDAGSGLSLNVLAGGAIIDTAGFNATSVRGLLNGGGGGGLTKNGAGLLTLSQTNTYTGATVVNGGGLAYILPMSSSSLTLANGVSNNITANNNSWTNSTTSVTNAIINFALGNVTAVPTATTPVIRTTNLNVSGVNTINITSGAGMTPGVVKLIDYSGGSRSGGGSFVLGTLPAGLQATLVDGPNDVRLNVTLSVQSLVWTASVNNEWATNGLLNWNTNTLAYQEYPSGVGDVVNFTDAAGVFYTVNLTNNVKPASVVIDHSSITAVTLSGAGQITGVNGITKTGTGTTILSLSNTFTGVVSVNNGILQVDNGGALGSTNGGGTIVTGTGTVAIGDGIGAGTTVTGETITLDGGNGVSNLGQLRGSIDSGSPNVWAGPIILAGNYGRVGTDINGNLTVAGPISCSVSNYFVLYRPGNGGTITVSNAAHSIAGSATFMGSGAVVKLGVNNGFSTNVLQVGPGNTDLNGFNQTISGLAEFSSPGVLINNGAGPSTLTINVPVTTNYIASANIQDGSSTISLVKLGGGLQTLSTNSSASTYTGPTSVNEGELRVNGNLANSPVTVASGAVLSGNKGNINGTITINSGGTLAPGSDIIGVLTNTSTVSLNAGSTSFFKLSAFGSQSDRLVANSISYAGTLVVTNSGATPLTNGQVFQLVSATSPSGTFANAGSVSILPGGTGTFNPATGQLTITSVPSGPTLNVAQSGNSLQFSWNSLNGTYRLQVQTNSLNTGLGTNWFNYATGTTNPVTVPINPADPAVFFRLVAP